MREEAADGDVVDCFPIPIARARSRTCSRTYVGGEGVEVSGVGLDGVRRGVALAQVAQEVVGGALDDRSADNGARVVDRYAHEEICDLQFVIENHLLPHGVSGFEITNYKLQLTNCSSLS